MTSLEPFRRLAKLVARAFYDEEYPPKDLTKKLDKADNRGNAIVILDALSRRQWTKEEVLAQQLHLHPKQVRRTLRALQEDRLVVRETRKENARTTKRLRMAVAAEAGEAAPQEKEGDDRVKQHEFSYCALDYGQLYDVIRYRILKAKKKIKDELEDKDTIQEYACPDENCKRIFSALDVSRLVDPVTLTLQCDTCHTELVEKTNQLQVGQEAEGEGGAVATSEGEDRKTRRAKLRNMLERMEKHLQPLTEQLARVKDIQPPHYRTLAEWEAKASATQRAVAMGLDLPQTVQKQHAAHASPMPFVGETKVEVNIGGSESGLAAGSELAGASKPQKVIPAWVIREGMKLTAAQRGETKTEPDEDVKPGKRLKTEEGTETIEDPEQQRLAEYYKAYYAALQARQVADSGAILGQAAADGATATATAVKTEVKDEAEVEEEDEGVEWEDDSAPPGGTQDTQDDGFVLDDPEEDYEWEGDDGAGGANGGLPGGSQGEVEGSSQGMEDNGAQGDGLESGIGSGAAFFDDGDDVDWDDG